MYMKNIKHSAMKPFVKTLLSIFLLWQGLTAAAQNQVVVNAVVLPPYTTQLSDYVDNPDKLQVSFINTTSADLEVYIQGSVTGDNGISISTDPSYIMPAPVLLQPGIPFRLDMNNIQDVFSADHLIYNGITRDELLRTGSLPEGNYQFCFRVYDYQTHQLLSNDQAGCSNFFAVIYQDPPVITYPTCGSDVDATEPQNLLISWTPSVGPLSNVHYRLIMVEMHPSDRNPMDALMTANPDNYFIEEEDLTVPQLYIGPSYPALDTGRSYAFVVQAYDPDNKIVFNNNGTSEVCWFRYKAPARNAGIGAGVLANAGDNMQTFLDEFAMLPSTQISGRLLYMMASDARRTGAKGSAQAMTSAGKQEKWNRRNENATSGSNAGIAYYNSFPAGGGDANRNGLSLSNFQYFSARDQARQMNLPPPLGSGVINAGLFSTNGGRPLAGIRVKLVARLTLRESQSEKIKLENYHFFDLMGHGVPLDKVRDLLGKPLAVTTTNKEGNYTFNFRQDFFTGPFLYAYGLNASGGPDMNNYQGYIALKLEVENIKFCSPDVDIFALPGDRLHIPDQLALIRDYGVNVQVISAIDSSLVNTAPEGAEKESGGGIGIYTYDVHPKAVPGEQPLIGVKVLILRDMQKIGNEHKAILMAEGSGEGRVIENTNGRFKVVFEGETNDSGIVHVPHLVQRWDQVDGRNGTPYYYLVQTRDTSKENQIETTDKNYGTRFGPFITQDVKNADNYIFTSFDHAKRPVSNSRYEPAKDNDFLVQMKALPPEIKGHLMAASNLENIGLSQIIVQLFAKDKPGDDLDLIKAKALNNGGEWKPNLYQLLDIYHREDYRYTNEAGFFRFRNLPVKADLRNPAKPVAAGPYRRLQIDSRLYKRIIWPPFGHDAYNLVYGDLKYLKFQLEPKQFLYGEVVDEEGRPVAAYLRLLPNNPYVKTESSWALDSHHNLIQDQRFRLAVAETDNVIEVVPLSHQYFPDTIRLGGLPSDNQLRIVVKKKLHRLALRVKDRKTGRPVTGAAVVVGDSLEAGRTTDQGTLVLTFPSPGEQFTVRIGADGYAPVQKIFILPVSSHWKKVETIYLTPARSIVGRITEKDTQKPIPDAQLYVELQNTGGQRLYISARSNADGRYQLKGIPAYYRYLRVHVVKEGSNPSYNGVEEEVELRDMYIENGRLRWPQYDFALERVDADLSHVWGFPSVIEKVSRDNGRITAVTGYLHDLPGEVNLQTLNDDEKVYFENLRVETKEGRLQPVDDHFYTTLHKIPVKLNGGFSGTLTNEAGAFLMPLRVDQKEGKAYIDGVLKLDLSSFKFAYDFHGDLYLGDDTLRPYLRVFNAGQSPVFIVWKKYYVFDMRHAGLKLQPVPIRNYRIFGFPASSDFARSYYQQGRIHIGTVLHTDIPMPGRSSGLDLKINVGEVVITRDDIALKTSDTRFGFDLEKWKVESTGPWYFDKNRDAIVLTQASVQTGLGITAGVKNLLIRPDALREGELDLGQGLSLGGVVPLKIAPGLKPLFNFDAGVGHYRISLTGTSDQPAAWADHLPALDGRLEFLSVDLLSDNSTETALGKTFRFHHVVDVFVDQVASGEHYFSLVGMPEIGVPKMISGQARMTYYKKNGKVMFRMEPLNARVDCNANVLFTLDQDPSRQTLEPNLFTGYGRFRIEPPHGEGGSPIFLDGKLVRTPDAAYIDVLPQDIKIGRETMHVSGGRITATRHDWHELRFTALTRSRGMDDDNKLTFVVHGGIEANGDKIKVDNINTPFGGFEMAYLFPEKALTGHLTINVPITTGYGTITRGMMDMRFDPKGFYFGIEGHMIIMGIPVEGGAVVGDYEASVDAVNSRIFAHMHKKPENMPALTGVYIIGEAQLVQTHFTLLELLTVKVDAGMGAYVGMNFAQNFKVTGGGYGYLDAKGGVNTMCGFFGVQSTNFSIMSMSYSSGTFGLCSCGKSSYEVSFCGESAGIGVAAGFQIFSDGTKNKFLDINGSCPSPPCNK
jgi:TANFOR domain-containing protein